MEGKVLHINTSSVVHRAQFECPSETQTSFVNSEKPVIGVPVRSIYRTVSFN